MKFKNDNQERSVRRAVEANAVLNDFLLLSCLSALEERMSRIEEKLASRANRETKPIREEDLLH